MDGDTQRALGEIQRSLGRIEGKLNGVCETVEIVQTGLGDHKNDDQKNFSAMRALVFSHRDTLTHAIQDSTSRFTQALDANNDKVAAKLIEYNKERETHLNKQDTAIASIKADIIGLNNAKQFIGGAGWVIKGLASLFGVVICGVLIALLVGWIKVHS